MVPIKSTQFWKFPDSQANQTFNGAHPVRPNLLTSSKLVSVNAETDFYPKTALTLKPEV